MRQRRGREPVRDILRLPGPTGLPPEKRDTPPSHAHRQKAGLAPWSAIPHTHGRGRLFRGGTGKALSEPFTNIHVVFQNDSDPDLETS